MADWREPCCLRENAPSSIPSIGSILSIPYVLFVLIVPSVPFKHPPNPCRQRILVPRPRDTKSSVLRPLSSIFPQYPALRFTAEIEPLFPLSVFTPKGPYGIRETG